MLLPPLLSLLAPHECLSCGAEGVLMCDDCCQNLKPAVKRCYACHAASDVSKTCSSCRRHSFIYTAHTAVRYQGMAKDIVWKLKFGRARAAATEIARQLPFPFASSEAVLVTHVPTATNRVRQRGYDQAALIARSYAHVHGVAYAPLLSRQGTVKQTGASKVTRIVQLRDAFRPIRAQRIKGSHILLIDDVITTGATLQAAATVLQSAGARRVEAVVFAQA